MKLLATLMTIAIASTAGATVKECTAKMTSKGQVTETALPLVAVVHPNADIASYVFDNNIGEFQVRITEADGTYFVSVRTAHGKVFTQGVEEANLSVTSGKSSLDLYCH